jgi:hypothetical protein
LRVGLSLVHLAIRCALCITMSAALALEAPRAQAQNPCSGGCKAAYGNCYKLTHDRGKCQGQLQRCLEGCIHGKRWRAAEGQWAPGAPAGQQTPAAASPPMCSQSSAGLRSGPCAPARP